MTNDTYYVIDADGDWFESFTVPKDCSNDTIMNHVLRITEENNITHGGFDILKKVGAVSFETKVKWEV